MSLMRREKRLPWQKAIEFAVQICQALKAAHDAGIIHRDLKPSNLLVTPEGVVKLTDFGVAQVFASNRLTATGGIIGTAEYMSPEQAQGRRAGKQSDLYSLGAVLYAMVTGRTPFSGSTAVEVIQKHKFGLFDRPKMYVPDLPQRVDDAICRLLEKDPEKRFPDALVLLRHLEQVVRLEEFAATGITLGGESVGEVGASTVVSADDEQAASAQHPGPATLMQTLIRAELADGKEGVLTSLFNNVYVLVGLLGLVIAGGVLWFRHRPTQQELFDRGAALLKEKPGPEWLRAKREYFEPLLAADPATWREPLDPLLQQIEIYELTRPARGRRGGSGGQPKSEGERLVHLALHYRQVGDVARAERTLAALQAVLAGDERQAKLYEMTGQLLDDVRSQMASVDDRDALLENALSRAAERAKTGAMAEARQIWGGIVELYGDDPAAAEFVKQARAGLENREAN